MSQTPEKNTPILPEDMYEDDEINILDLLLIILKRKGMIFKIVTTVFFLSIIISLFLPKSYVATTTILPPQEKSSSMTGLLSQAGGSLGGLASGLLGVGGSSSDIYVGILRSRSVADNIINKYDLRGTYEIKYMADMYKKLAGMTSFNVDNKSQIISISVEGRDPQLSANIANSYVEELDIINRKVNISEGQRKRIFLEKRLQSVKQDLIKAETSLKSFQEKYKLVSIDEQAKVAIEGAAEIKAQIIAVQTELEVLKDFGTEKQNEAVRLQATIKELQKQLSNIESGGDEKQFYIPFNELPELGIQLARLMREFKIQENVFELLTSQYEMAKIEEAKDIDTIQVLDVAVPSDKKAKPKRSLIVILCSFFAFFCSVFFVFFLEYIGKVKVKDEDLYNMLVNNFKVFNLKKSIINLIEWIKTVGTR